MLHHLPLGLYGFWLPYGTTDLSISGKLRLQVHCWCCGWWWSAFYHHCLSFFNCSISYDHDHSSVSLDRTVLDRSKKYEVIGIVGHACRGMIFKSNKKIMLVHIEITWPVFYTFLFIIRWSYMCMHNLETSLVDISTNPCFLTFNTSYLFYWIVPYLFPEFFSMFCLKRIVALVSRLYPFLNPYFHPLYLCPQLELCTYLTYYLA